MGRRAIHYISVLPATVKDDLLLPAAKNADLDPDLGESIMTEGLRVKLHELLEHRGADCEFRQHAHLLFDPLNQDYAASVSATGNLIYADH